MMSPIVLGIEDIEPASTQTSAAANDGSPTAAAKLVDLSAYRVAWDVQSPPALSRSFVLGDGGEGIFPLGKPSVLAGPGGTFKTALMLLLGMHVATGKRMADLKIGEGASLFVSAEDDGEECRRRLIAMARTEFDPAQYARLQRRVRVIDLAGRDVRLTTKPGYGSPARTELGDAIVAEALDLMRATDLPVRLIVIDHARLAIGGDLNDSESVTLALTVCSDIAIRTNAAVVLLCHSPKSAVGTQREDYGAQDVLGSGAFVDNARCACVMTALNDQERKRFGLDATAARERLALRVVKSNYSESGRIYYFEKRSVPGWSVAYPRDASLRPAVKAATNPSAAVEQRIFDEIKAAPGRYTLRSLRDLAGQGGRLGASDREVRAALGDLISQRRVAQREPTEDEIAAYGVRKRDKVLHAAT